MADTKIKYAEMYADVGSSSTYSAAEVARIRKDMKDFIAHTSPEEKLAYLRKLGILDEQGKLTKEYGG